MGTFGLLIGTYTDPGYASAPGEGVYAASCRDGVIDALRLAAPIANPSWLVPAPERAVAYCVNELADGALVGVGLAPGRDPEERGSAPTGADPAHVAITPDGRFAITADYTGGSITTVAIDSDGDLAPSSYRRLMSELVAAPAGPSHPHFIGFDPVTGEVVVADLGLDRVVFFGLGAGGLGAHPTRVLPLPPGTGPRRFAFSSDGDRLFVLGELDATLSSFRRSSQGFEPEARISTLQDGRRPAAAELLRSDDGSTLYATNRGDDSIAVLDVASGAPHLVATVAAEVRTPRGAALTPDGHLLVAGQDDGRIVSFSLDDPHRPRPHAETAVPVPVCLQIVDTAF